MEYAVIMAGGSGTRFWPRSTRKKPKQFLKLFGDRTMLQATVDRITPMIPINRVMVITNADYVDLVQQQLPDLPAENIIGEPVARNTAPCVALAAALLERSDPGSTMIVLPADHHITRPDRFLSILETAAARAKDNGLVTIGIKPDSPETGFGYIQIEEDTGETFEGNTVFRVATFTEKPDRETAEQFLESGNYLWNSGMFIWQSDTISREFEQYQPEIYEQMKEIIDSGGPPGNGNIEQFYRSCPSISIDYGIMEHAEDVFVVPGSFGWSDVGSWTAVYELRDKDENGNVIQVPQHVLVDSSNNLVQSESGKLLAVVGMENVAVVETVEAILVCNLDKAQGVKQVVEALKNDPEKEKYL